MRLLLAKNLVKIQLAKSIKSFFAQDFYFPNSPIFKTTIREEEENRLHCPRNDTEVS